MTDTASASVMLTDTTEALDPLADIEEGAARNRAKVGSARPSSLLYTYGPGSIMDLPGFSVMPAGLDDWEPIWKRREYIPSIIEPRLLDVVRLHLGPQVESLRPFPWQPKQAAFSKEGVDLGIPARVFPQWFRCTGCDYLGPLPRFNYTNTIRSVRTWRSSPIGVVQAAAGERKAPPAGGKALPCRPSIS